MHQLREVTFEGHVYLDHHYPPVLWNIVRGGFSSVDMLPERERNFGISISLASMLQNSSVNRLEAELALEIARQAVSPSSVSRLKGLFVFDDIESVAQIWEKNSWGTHFQTEYLADVGVYARNSSRVDANWISDVIATDGSLLPEWINSATNYWLGLPHPSRDPIWERIVEGSFCVWSMHSKLAGLREIQAIWPESLGLLAHSINCFGVGSLDGQSFPGLTVNDGVISVEYYLRMVDSLDGTFVDRLRDEMGRNPKRFSGPPDLARMNLPDLTGYAVHIPVDQKSIAERVLATLHRIHTGFPH